MLRAYPLRVALLLSTLLIPFFVGAQETTAPNYTDGDWWRVKVHLDRTEGAVTGRCHETYPEYLVEFRGGQRKVYGLSGGSREELDCGRIANEVLGGKQWNNLSFPISVGRSWTGQWYGGRRRGRTVDASYKVLAWEKNATPKGAFQAFKIEAEIEASTRGGSSSRKWTYYYAPEAKAVISFKRETNALTRTVTLVDYKVSK